MKQLNLLLCALILASTAYGQHIINSTKVIAQSTNAVSLFQSNSSNGNWASGVIWGDRWGVFKDATSSKEWLTILANGNVGIGAVNPDSKLTVAGNIHAREVKVTVNAGADFVFANDYKLRSLEETSEFVKTNQHLPEIQSEKEMIENGLELGEMNIRLLQKIEELTLYLIEQNEVNKAQALEIKALQAANIDLNEKLSKLNVR